MSDAMQLKWDGREERLTGRTERRWGVHTGESEQSICDALDAG